MDLCVTVSFCEQAKLLWHKAHDIYSQKCGINCYHPHFLMGTYFLVTIVSVAVREGPALPCEGRAGNGGGAGSAPLTASIVRQPLDAGSSIMPLWKLHFIP